MFIKKSEFEKLRNTIEDLKVRVDYLDDIQSDRFKDCKFMKSQLMNINETDNSYTTSFNDELMKLLNNLNDKVKLFEFKQENPLGMAIIKKNYLFSLSTYLKYIKDNKLKEIYIGSGFNDFELNKSGNIIETSIDKRLEYKFDINREILIQIKETNLNKENKKGKRRVK